MGKMIFTLEWIGNQGGYLKLVDQTKLPHKLVYLKCTTVEQVASAIKTLAVRGAPAIGVAAAFGAYLGVRNDRCTQMNTELRKRFVKVYQMLLSTRPTAVNLRWALDRINKVVKQQLSLRATAKQSIMKCHPERSEGSRNW